MIATYRLQLGPHLDLEGARQLVPYLRTLGASHLYLSPVWRARAGSTHGYDVVDPRHVSSALGGESALRALAEEGLGLILDVVPNHMAIGDENPFWADPALRERFFDRDPASGRHRRFFDIDELAGVRMEDPDVFAVCHEKIAELVADGVAAGLRVDHPDGLADPAQYLERLARLGAPLWVEKITEPGEQLPDWPVQGTTGYDFMNEAMGVFVAAEAQPIFDDLYLDMSLRSDGFTDVAAAAKREQAHSTFAPEVERMQRLSPIADLADATAALPVYRTYVVPERAELSGDDRAVIEGAELPPPLRDALLLRADGQEELVRRFQQTTGAVMAKGVEDTAFYRYLRLVALNEVGGDPGLFGRPVAEFHEAAVARAKRHPRSLLASTTHDTKRSGDVRARLLALTHRPERWARQVRDWREAHAGLRKGRAPDGDEEYLLYQTLLGAWPISQERLDAYLVKAMREAKSNTAWVDGDPAWERAVLGFAGRVLARPGFTGELEALLADLAPSIECITLGQTVLKLTAPGVPDIYQGDEDELLALVDPDNRRPVDWERLRFRLADPPPGSKIGLVQRALGLRARQWEAFAGSYGPLGTDSATIAFTRDNAVVVAIPLAPDPPLQTIDAPAELAGRWRDATTGSRIELRPGPNELDRRIALLERSDS